MEEAKGLIDKIRVRAGIPTIDEAWKKANHPEKANTAEGLREIVRRERQIEFYLENQRFWDLRRWKDAGILGEKVWGMNIEGDTDETFFVPTELQNIRTFKQAQYLMPIPMTETNKVLILSKIQDINHNYCLKEAYIDTSWVRISLFYLCLSSSRKHYTLKRDY